MHPLCDALPLPYVPLRVTHDASLISLYYPSNVLYFSSFHWLDVWGCGLRTDRVTSLSPSLAQLTIFNNM